MRPAVSLWSQKPPYPGEKKLNTELVKDTYKNPTWPSRYVNLSANSRPLFPAPSLPLGHCARDTRHILNRFLNERSVSFNVQRSYFRVILIFFIISVFIIHWKRQNPNDYSCVKNQKLCLSKWYWIALVKFKTSFQ